MAGLFGGGRRGKSQAEKDAEAARAARVHPALGCGRVYSHDQPRRGADHGA